MSNHHMPEEAGCHRCHITGISPAKACNENTMNCHRNTQSIQKWSLFRICSSCLLGTCGSMFLYRQLLLEGPLAGHSNRSFCPSCDPVSAGQQSKSSPEQLQHFVIGDIQNLGQGTQGTGLDTPGSALGLPESRRAQMHGDLGPSWMSLAPETR